MAPRTILCHHKHCSSLYQGALPSSHLKYLNKAISLQIYTKYNRQCTGAELATCTAHVYYINRPALRYIRCDITLCNSLPEQIMNNISLRVNHYTGAIGKIVQLMGRGKNCLHFAQSWVQQTAERPPQLFDVQCPCWLLSSGTFLLSERKYRRISNNSYTLLICTPPIFLL